MILMFKILLGIGFMSAAFVIIGVIGMAGKVSEWERENIQEPITTKELERWL